MRFPNGSFSGLIDTKATNEATGFDITKVSGNECAHISKTILLSKPPGVTLVLLFRNRATNLKFLY